MNFSPYLSNSFIAAKLKNKNNPIKSLTWKTFLLHAEFEYTMCYLQKSFHAKINLICMTNVGALLKNTKMFRDQSCLMSNYILRSMQNISTAHKVQLISKCLLVSSISCKSEWKHFDLRYHRFKVEFFCSFFGRIEDTKKSFIPYFNVTVLEIWILCNTTGPTPLYVYVVTL